ncbi:MAG TPA: amidohydrolase family protein [Bryobacteraceae bacterium]
MRFLILALVAAVSPSFAQPYAITGGTLIDGYGGPPIRDAVIVGDGERIVAVGARGQVTIPTGAQIIPAEGMSILPGLWDMHVHLMLSGHSDYDHWDKTYPGQFESVIMPASARQLLMAGITSARDLGAPLEASIHVRDRVNKGELAGPTLYVSGPFIQHAAYPGTELFRWGVKGPDDGRSKVRKLAAAGVDTIKLIDQDEMTMDEVRAVVDEAHRAKLKVVAHAHRPLEILRGLEAGVNCFEHTGMATAPEYPPEIMNAIKARTARGGGAGPLFWTPTISVLYNYDYLRTHPMVLDDTPWHEGLPPSIIEDIQRSIAFPERLSYYSQVPYRMPTLRRKFDQLRESGVTMMIGTDSGVPMNFHSQSTWNELDVWVNHMGVDPMDAIRAATYWPAVMMRVEKDSGTIAPGKFADIIAVRGDVLRHIDLLSRVDLIIKHGVRYK